MKQNTLKTIKSMLGKTISKTMNYSGNEQRIKEKLGWMSPVQYRLHLLAA